MNYTHDKNTNKLLPVFESRNAGTKVFVYVNESNDDAIIPFEFKFEHHLSSPEMKATDILIPNSSETTSVQIPEFHFVELSGGAGTKMKNNSVKLIGSYRPADYDKNAKRDLMGIVFLKVSIRQVR